jgi:hypothetical protein
MTRQITLKIKPLSVNDAFQGRRFKSKEYKAYEKELLYRLPALTMPQPPYKVSYVFGMSNVLSDYDNPVKPLQDVLQTKYKFNDAHIYEANIRKVKVNKGEEYFAVTFESIKEV